MSHQHQMTKMLNAFIAAIYGLNLMKVGLDVDNAISGHIAHVQERKMTMTKLLICAECVYHKFAVCLDKIYLI